MKELVQSAGVPTARHGTFTDVEPACAMLDTLPPPFVVKTDGLAAGKGVLVTESLAEARNAVGDYLSGAAFGDAGRRLVIEEGLVGPELSVLAVCDGTDAVLLRRAELGSLFSLARAYFMVDMEVPSGYVQFLRAIMPNKPRSELYIMLGLGKQGKTMFFRDFIYHLHHSEDKFIMAPGIRGLVMLVFTLPSYPYVFKIIKDVFGASKNMDRATVKRKFKMVKQVDRVGRMADTLEFSNVLFPLNRFDDEVLQELQTLAPSCFEIDGEQLIIKHLYIERRMEPLNIHLDRMERSNNIDGLEHAIKEYGSAIREMAQANIFPGDMLWKNFGVTRFGRVVFYDYDEIEYMTDCSFRRIPPAPDFETEMSGEIWYAVGKNDVFPEEFSTFLLASPVLRKVFHKHHADLLSPKFWQDSQQKIRDGHVEDFFPYPQELRFCNTPLVTD